MGLSDLCIRRPVFATVLSLIIVLLGIAAVPAPAGSRVSQHRPAGGQRAHRVSRRQRRDHRDPGHPGARGLARRHRGHRLHVLDQPRRRPATSACASSSAAIPTSRRATCATGSAGCAAVCPTRSRSRSSRRPRPTPSRSSISSFSSDRHSPLELTDYADRYVKNQIQTLPGVAEVQIFGERRYAMRIWLDPLKLAAYDLTPQDVEDALRAQNVEVPAGRIESRAREFTVVSETDLTTPEEFDDIVVKQAGGYLVRLSRRRPGRARRRGRHDLHAASTAGPRSRSASSSRRPPTRSTCPRRCTSVCPEVTDRPARGHAGRDRLRQVDVHRRVDRQRQRDDRRGDRPGRPDHLPVPALVARDDDPAGHHPGER